MRDPEPSRQIQKARQGTSTQTSQTGTQSKNQSQRARETIDRDLKHKNQLEPTQRLGPTKDSENGQIDWRLWKEWSGQREERT